MYGIIDYESSSTSRHGEIIDAFNNHLQRPLTPHLCQWHHYTLTTSQEQYQQLTNLTLTEAPHSKEQLKAYKSTFKLIWIWSMMLIVKLQKSLQRNLTSIQAALVWTPTIRCYLHATV